MSGRNMTDYAATMTSFRIEAPARFDRTFDTVDALDDGRQFHPRPRHRWPRLRPIRDLARTLPHDHDEGLRGDIPSCQRQLAESYLTRGLLGQILRRIQRLGWRPT